MNLRDFSEHLSKLSGIDFTEALNGHSGELNGLMTYLSRRSNELRKERFSEDEVSAIITLNLISSFSLWLGFSKAKDSSNFQKELENNRAESTKHNRISVNVSLSDYRVGIIIPTNMKKSDSVKIERLEKLIKSLIPWKQLAGIWVVGSIPHQFLSQFMKLKNVEVVNMKDDRGPARARNIGIDRALKVDSDLIIFMDDDVVDPISDSFKSLCDTIVSGNDIYTPKIQSLGDTCFDLFHDVDGTLNGVYEQEKFGKRLVYGTTCVMICPGNVLREGLKFDEDFPLAAGEDIDFCIRARKSGHDIIPADRVIVQHDYGYGHTDDSLMKFISRFVRYGEGNSIIRERQPEYFNSLTNALRRPTELKSDKGIRIPEAVRSLSKIVGRCIK